MLCESIVGEDMKDAVRRVGGVLESCSSFESAPGVIVTDMVALLGDRRLNIRHVGQLVEVRDGIELLLRTDQASATSALQSLSGSRP